MLYFKHHGVFVAELWRYCTNNINNISLLANPWVSTSFNVFLFLKWLRKIMGQFAQTCHAKKTAQVSLISSNHLMNVLHSRIISGVARGMHCLPCKCTWAWDWKICITHSLQNVFRHFHSIIYNLLSPTHFGFCVGEWERAYSMPWNAF